MQTDQENVHSILHFDMNRLIGPLGPALFILSTNDLYLRHIYCKYYHDVKDISVALLAQID